MGEVQKTDNRQLAKPFTWRDSGGRFHYPSDMETRHLYFTLRMIWNHNMPLQIGGYVRRYTFGPFYTKAYFREAIVACARELFKRKDLTAEMRNGLDEMRAYFYKEVRQELLA